MANKNELAKSTLVEEVALAKINQYMELGLVLPQDYSPTNSLKKARLMLNDMQIEGRPALEMCTKESVLSCLIEMVTKGYDVSSMQAYFIPRKTKNGYQMTLMESVYGRITRAKRASKNYKPIVQFVHQDDIFKYGIDVKTGYTVVEKHETCLENKDKPIIAAYAYVTDNEGNTEVVIMSQRDWISSWKKSANGCAVAKEFAEDMIFRTIVKKSTKKLVNAAVNAFIPTSNNDDDDTILAGDKQPEFTQQVVDTEAEEIKTEEGDIVDVASGEVLKPAEEKKNEPEF